MRQINCRMRRENNFRWKDSYNVNPLPCSKKPRLREVLCVSEMASPKRIGHDCNRSSSGFCVFLTEQPPALWPHRQDAEERSIRHTGENSFLAFSLPADF